MKYAIYSTAIALFNSLGSAHNQGNTIFKNPKNKHFLEQDAHGKPIALMEEQRPI